MQKLRDDGGSGLVTIPKRYLEKDDVLEEDNEIPGGVAVDVERLDRRTYAVRVAEDGDFPELREAKFIERIVGERLFSEGFAPGSAD